MMTSSALRLGRDFHNEEGLAERLQITLPAFLEFDLLDLLHAPMALLAGKGGARESAHQR